MPLKAEETARSLGDSINTATRSVHTKLNKLIVARLPLAIPPQAQDPSNYVSGLLHITPIYNTFESLWQDILKAPVSKSEGSGTVSDGHSCEGYKPSSAVHHVPNGLDAPHGPVVCSRVQSLLDHLHTTDLERTESLKQDIASMSGWSPELLEQQLGSAAESPSSQPLSSIYGGLYKNAHMFLLAYAWVLYMALFSGGRFIRASLSRVDLSFWYAISMVSGARRESVMIPLQFFTFTSPNDGDDIKLAFKKRLAESEMLLTREEQDDVITEAQRIFEFMIEVVGELDEICGMDDVEIKEDQEEGIMWRMSRLLGLRTRDSVVVAKERKAWTRLLSERSIIEEEDDYNEYEEGGDGDYDADGSVQTNESANDGSLPCWHGEDRSEENRHLTFAERRASAPR